jgi:hypothetical protein
MEASVEQSLHGGITGRGLQMFLDDTGSSESPKSDSNTDFVLLDQDTLLEVLLRCDGTSLAALGATCKTMRQACRTEALWQRLFLHRGFRYRPAGQWAACHADADGQEEAALVPQSWFGAYLQASRECFMARRRSRTVYVGNARELEEAVRHASDGDCIVITKPGTYACLLHVTQSNVSVRPAEDCMARSSIHLRSATQKQENNTENHTCCCILVEGQNASLHVWGMTIIGSVHCDGLNARVTLTECDIHNNSTQTCSAIRTTTHSAYAVLKNCDVTSYTQAFSGKGTLDSCTLTSLDRHNSRAQAVVKLSGGADSRIVNSRVTQSRKIYHPHHHHDISHHHAQSHDEDATDVFSNAGTQAHAVHADTDTHNQTQTLAEGTSQNGADDDTSHTTAPSIHAHDMHTQTQTLTQTVATTHAETGQNREAQDHHHRPEPHQQKCVHGHNDDDHNNDDDDDVEDDKMGKPNPHSIHTASDLYANVTQNRAHADHENMGGACTSSVSIPTEHTHTNHDDVTENSTHADHDDMGDTCTSTVCLPTEHTHTNQDGVADSGSDTNTDTAVTGNAHTRVENTADIHTNNDTPNANVDDTSDSDTNTAIGADSDTNNDTLNAHVDNTSDSEANTATGAARNFTAGILILAGTDCSIHDSYVYNCTSWGVHVRAKSHVSMRECVVAGNYGGGVYAEKWPHPVNMKGCKILAGKSNDKLASICVDGCEIRGNRGAGLYVCTTNMRSYMWRCEGNMVGL